MKSPRTLLATVALLATACDVTLRFEGDASDSATPRDVAAQDVCAEPGSCGATCPVDTDCDATAAVCTGGDCACPSPTTLCSGSCFNLAVDRNHCGNCTTACPNGEHCSASQCITGNGKDGAM